MSAGRGTFGFHCARTLALDYDKTRLAASYDQARGYSPEVLRLWLDRIQARVPREAVSRIVDLGCGTGRYSFALAEAFEARVIGIDPSETMLAQAMGKSADARVQLLRSLGEALPLPDGAVDLVFLSMVFHHLKDPAQVARECRRVLGEGGSVVLRNGVLEELESNPHAAFFPHYRAAVEPLLLTRRRLTSVFEDAGFEPAGHEVVRHPMAENWPDCARKAARRADSFLAGLSDADFQTGLSALECHAAQSDPRERVTVNVDLFVFRRS